MEEENNLIFNESDYAKKDALVNPFFYKREEDRVLSLEDFAVVYKQGAFKKKEVVYLRSVIRNSLIKKKRRLRVFKKYIRKNKKDFDNNIALQQEKYNQDKKELKNFDFNKVTFKRMFFSIILMILGIALGLLFMPSIANMTGLSFIITMNEHIQSRMSNVFMAIAVAPGAFAIINFLYLCYFSLANHKYVKIQQRKFKAFDRYLVKARHAIKKCYKRINKYYKKQILSDNFMYEALTLDELWDLNVDYNEDDLEKEEVARNNKKVVKRNKHYKGFSKTLMFFVLLFTIVLLGYEIFSIFR